MRYNCLVASPMHEFLLNRLEPTRDGLSVPEEVIQEHHHVTALMPFESRHYIVNEPRKFCLLVVDRDGAIHTLREPRKRCCLECVLVDLNEGRQLNECIDLKSRNFFEPKAFHNHIIFGGGSNINNTMGEDFIINLIIDSNDGTYFTDGLLQVEVLSLFVFIILFNLALA